MYRKKNLLSVIALVCALIALVLSVIAMLPGRTGPDQSYENPALEQQVQELQAQVAALNARLEAMETVPGLADWNLAASAWEDGAGADVTLTALPDTGSDGMQLTFRVLLEGREVAAQNCTEEDGAFTATVSLPAEDGYGYYCELVSPDGSRRQIPLTTPENPTDEHLIYLHSSLNAYCILTINQWSAEGSELVISQGHIEVQLPLVGSFGDTAAEKAELILLHGGSEIGRTELEGLTTPVGGRMELTLADLSFPIPELQDEDYLELILEVTLTDGQTITAPGAGWYQSGDGLTMVVG